MRSRVTLARIEAALIAGSMASPSTIARAGQGASSGTCVPSISASCGTGASAASARAMPSRVARKMLCRSMSSTLTSTTLNASARSRMRAASAARRAGPSTFESASPRMRRAGSSITAATTTGPASGPRPASSTPAVSGGHGSIMQRLELVKDVIVIGIEQALVGAIQIGAMATFAQQRVGLEQGILRHAGDIQDQRAGEAEIERRIGVAARRLEVALQHVIGDVVRIRHRRRHDLGELAHRTLERGLMIAEMEQHRRPAAVEQGLLDVADRRV